MIYVLKEKSKWHSMIIDYINANFCYYTDDSVTNADVCSGYIEI